jgi:hypothetical protein
MTKYDILDLLTNDEISNAIKALRAALPNDNTILNIAGQWNRLVKDKNAGTISNEYATLTGNQIRNALIELTNRLPEGTKVDIVFDPPVGGTTNGGAPQKKGPVVFLSYNHGDMEQAHKVKDFLKAKGIQVTIDSEAMQPGEDIAAFINKCIREADITLSLVSNKSLLSAWVGMESVNTLVGEKIADKRLIAVVIDSSFYDRGFVDTAFTTIEERMDELKKLMLARLEKDRGIEDLQSERTRNKNLLNDLPEIVANLRARLNIDISGDKFQQGMEKVAQSIINK